MKILLTGKDGQLGFELARSLMTLGEVVAVGRSDLDLERPERIRACLQDVQPDVIVNAAACTAVDKAESEPDRAWAVNAQAVDVMAAEAVRHGIGLVHYSTDYVFDGASPLAYGEADAPNPLNVYGASKLGGEMAIRASGCKHLILRTSWVYGAHGSNFVKTMLKLAATRNELKIVHDQFGAPTSARLIAQATAHLLARPDAFAQADGLFHLTCSGSTNWKDFAEAIFAEGDLLLQKAGASRPALIGIPASEYPAPARRPSNSRLACDRISQIFGLTLPHWRDCLRLCIQEL